MDEVGEVDFDLSEWTVLDDDNGSNDEIADVSTVEVKGKKSPSSSSASKTHKTAVKKSEPQKGNAKSGNSTPKSKTESIKQNNSSPKQAVSGKQPEKATNISSIDNQGSKTAVKSVGQDVPKVQATTSQPKTPSSKADMKAISGSSKQTKPNAKAVTVQKTTVVNSTPSSAKVTKVSLDSGLVMPATDSATAAKIISQKPDIKANEPKLISGTSGKVKPEINDPVCDTSNTAGVNVDAGLAADTSNVTSSKITELKPLNVKTASTKTVTGSTADISNVSMVETKNSKVTPSAKTDVKAVGTNLMANNSASNAIMTEQNAPTVAHASTLNNVKAGGTGLTTNTSNINSSKTALVEPKTSKATLAASASSTPSVDSNTSNINSSKTALVEPKTSKATLAASASSTPSVDSKLSTVKASPSKQKTDNASGTKAQLKPSGTPSNVNENKSVNVTSKPISQSKIGTPKSSKVNTATTPVTKVPTKASEPSSTSTSNSNEQISAGKHSQTNPQPTLSAHKSSTPPKAVNIDSESLAAIMMSVEKTNSLSSSIASGSDGKNVMKKSDVCGTKRATPANLPEPSKKKARLEDPVNSDILTETKKETILPVSSPALKQSSEEKSEKNKSLVENSVTAVNTLSNESSLKTSSKRIIRRFHRSTQTIAEQSERKINDIAHKTYHPDVDVSIQVGTQYKPNWQDEVRYIKSLPESVMPDVFKIISEFNVNKPNERNTVSGTFKYGVSLGHVAVTNLMKSPFKETFLLKVDNFNMFFTGPEIGVVDLYLNDEEKFTNLLTQIRKTRIGPRHLVVTVSKNLDEEERDPTCPLSNVKGTIVYDQNFSTSAFVLQSKAPVWNRPKAEETVSFHNIPGGVPVDFLKVLVPDAITIDLDDPESKFTKSGSCVVMNFARKSGDRTLKLFSQLYINNEFVPSTFGATQASHVPELKEIEKAKHRWLLEMEEKFPDSKLNSKEVVAVSRDINEGKQILDDVKKEITNLAAAAADTEKILSVSDNKVDGKGCMETELSTVSAALSDISDTSDIGNESSLPKPIPRVRAVQKKNSTKKHLESLKSTLKTLSTTPTKPNRSLGVARDNKNSKSSRTVKSNKDGHSSRSHKDVGKTSKTRSEKKTLNDSRMSRAGKSSEKGSERSPRTPRHSERPKDVAQDSSKSRVKSRSESIQEKLRQMRREKDKLNKTRSPITERHPRIEITKSKRSRDRSDDRSLGRSRTRHPHEESKWPKLDREGSRHSGRPEAPYDRGNTQAMDSARVYHDSSLDMLSGRQELMNREERSRVWSRSPVRQFVRGRSASPRRRSPMNRISDMGRAQSPASNLRRVIIRKSLSPAQEPLYLRRLGQNISPRERQSGIRDYISHSLSPISVGDDMDIAGPLGNTGSQGGAGPQGGVWLPQPPVSSNASTSRSQIQTISGRVFKEGDLRKTLSLAPGMKNLVSLPAERARQTELLSQAALKQQKTLSDSRDLLAKLVEHMKAASSSKQADSNLRKTIDVSQFLEGMKVMKPVQNEHMELEQRAHPQSDYRAPPQSEYRPLVQHEHRAPPHHDYRAPPQGQGARNVTTDMRAKSFESYETFSSANQGNPPVRPQGNFPAYGNNNTSLNRFPGSQQPPSTVLSNTGMRLPPPIPPPVAPPLYGSMISAQDRMSQLEALANQLASDIQKHQQQPGGQSVGGGQPRWNTPQPPNPHQMPGPPLPAPAMSNVNMNNIISMIHSQRMGTPQLNQTMRPNSDQSNARNMNPKWPSGNFF